MPKNKYVFVYVYRREGKVEKRNTSGVIVCDKTSLPLSWNVYATVCESFPLENYSNYGHNEDYTQMGIFCYYVLICWMSCVCCYAERDVHCSYEVVGGSCRK